MTATINTTASTVFTALRTFLIDILPEGVEVVKGLINRVSAPLSENYVVLWPLSQQRISTNETDVIDCKFKGVISGRTLTVTDLYYGTILIGAEIFGAMAGTKILSGTYPTFTVDKSQTLLWSDMASGRREDTQGLKTTVQVDIHGADSSDNVQIITTMFRSDWCADFFRDLALGIYPLTCGDPLQTQFMDDSQQINLKWSIDVELQINPIVAVPQQFMDEVIVEIQPPAEILTP